MNDKINAQTHKYLQDHKYSIESITSTKQMAAIKDEWKHLEKICAEPYIYFQSFDWCFQWCVEKEKTLENGQKLNIRIYIARRDGELIFILPMVLRKTFFNISCLNFISDPLGQYGNIIYNKQLVPLEIGKWVWDYIEKKAQANVINLDQYPNDSFLANIIQDRGIVEKSKKYSSVLNLDKFDTWSDYQASLESKTRKRRRRNYNKLAKQGDVEFKVYYGGSDEYRKHIALTLELKQIWLKKTGRHASTLSQSFTKQFLSNLPSIPATHSTTPTGAIVGVLTLDGKPIALEIGMCQNDHYYCYLGAFDWNYRNFSPGKVQMEMSQEWAKSIKMNKFDFLGHPADYQSEWVNSETSLESRSIYFGLRGYVYSVIWRANVRPALRSIFNNLNAKTRVRLLSLSHRKT